MQRFKDCLRRETNVIFPTLRYRSIFFQNDLSKQKRFHLLARQLHDECSASVSVEIICFEHFQQGSYEKLIPGIFSKITYSHVHRNLQPWSLFERWSKCSVLKSWNFSYPHYVTYFICQSLQIFTEKGTS